MSVKKYTDWKGWIEGFYDSWIDALCNTALAYGGSNALGNVPGLKDIGLSWKQAGGIFISITFWSIIRYVQSHKRPNVITETFETTHITKDPDTGAITETGTSKVTTVTPIDNSTPLGQVPDK